MSMGHGLVVASLSIASVLLSGSADASDVPVAWQLVDDGCPNDTVLFYYDTTAARVRGLEPNPPGLQPRLWEFGAGDRWRRVFAGGNPPLNDTACIGYDTIRQVLVHVDPTGATHEAGTAGWSAVTTLARPPAPVRCEMAFDGSRGVMVYIGVTSYDSNAPNATWEYDGTNWTEIHPTAFPPAGRNPKLTYDASRGLVLLFGEPFNAAAPVFQAYVWEYNGTTWRRLSGFGSGSPGRRSGHAWVHDPGRGKALLYSGTMDTVGAVADLWEWNGTRWTRLQEQVPPGARTGAAAVYDTARTRTVLHGGGGRPSAERLTTWALAQLSWTAVATWIGPRGYDDYAMAFLPSSREILVTGGADGHSTGSSETWLWGDGGWRHDAGTTAPTASVGFNIAFDERESVVVGMGGLPYPVQQPVSDTHRYYDWNSGWDSSVLAGPRARRNAGVTFSRELAFTLLFGGMIRDEQGVELDNATWRFTAGGWTEILVPEPLPAPRENCPLAADTLRGLVWMYGGNTAGGNQADLWRFDGSSWALASANSPPGPRAGHGLAHDPTRDRLVVFGHVGPTDDAATWEWGDGAWHRRVTAVLPEPDRWSVKLVYDPSREAVFLFGGQNDRGPRYDLWAYGADPDEDGIVGQLDNCRDVVNADQANLDGDPRGDDCDCAAGDPGTWAAPPEAGHLAFDVVGTAWTWDTVAAAAGPATVYDVLRGAVTDLPLTPSTPTTCIGAALPNPTLPDAAAPPAGVAWWYLARGRNSCGVGSYGTASSGGERANGGCG
jgi:hypothetical protein